ncbi:MAG: hypothetical protein IIA64_06370 [Planctomycetes bacterium]|nr:hypothetical protein [Planctomycetota bacterium]
MSCGLAKESRMIHPNMATMIAASAAAILANGFGFQDIVDLLGVLHASSIKDREAGASRGQFPGS